MQSIRMISLLILTLTLSGCEPEVQEINYGSDGCDYCRMTIVEEHYGTELLTKKGKAFKFDSIECLAAYVLKGEVDGEAVHSLHFTDVEASGQLFPLESMIFVQAQKLRSPMGLNLSAYQEVETAESVAELYFGETMTWDQVKVFVENAWLK